MFLNQFSDLLAKSARPLIVHRHPKRFTHHPQRDGTCFISLLWVPRLCLQPLVREQVPLPTREMKRLRRRRRSNPPPHRCVGGIEPPPSPSGRGVRRAPDSSPSLARNSHGRGDASHSRKYSLNLEMKPSGDEMSMTSSAYDVS